MFQQQGQASNHTPDVARFFAICIEGANTKLDHPRALLTLSTWDLLWFVAINWAHAIEIAGRALGVPPPPDPLARQALEVVDNPSPERLYDMGQAWRAQQPHLSDNEIREVAIHLILCRLKIYGGFCELIGRTRHLPVFSALLDLVEPPSDTQDEDVRRSKRFFEAMNGVLQRTVGRRLKCEQLNEGSLVMHDREGIAIAGAIEMENRIREWLTDLLSQVGTVIADGSGRSIKVPEIPELPVIGMAGASGTGVAWRSYARHFVVEEFLVWAVPGACEIFETALPDWAHAAQRDERDREDAQKRGGLGGPKARRKFKEARRKSKEAGQEDSKIIEHVRMRGTPNPESDAEVPRVLRIGNPSERSEDSDDPSCIDPKDPRPRNPETVIEVTRILAEAERRHGPSCRKFIDDIMDGYTIKEAAKRAEISTRTGHSRLKELRDWAKRH